MQFAVAKQSCSSGKGTFSSRSRDPYLRPNSQTFLFSDAGCVFAEIGDRMQKRDHLGLAEEHAVAQGVKKLRLENDTHVIQQQPLELRSLPQIQEGEEEQAQRSDVDYNSVNAFLRDLHNSRVIRRKMREAQSQFTPFAGNSLSNPQEEQAAYYSMAEETKESSSDHLFSGYSNQFSDFGDL